MRYILIITAIVAFSSIAFAANNLSTGLVGYWPMDSRDLPSSTAVLDRSGNNGTGTRQNTPTLVVGKVGSTFQFNGSNQYIQVPDSNGLDLAGGSLTIGMWVKPTTLKNYGNLIWKASYPTDGYGIITFSNGDIGWEVSPEAVSNPSMGAGSLVNGTWTHVVITEDGSKNVRFYKNGTLVATTLAYAFAPLAGTHVLQIGTDTDNNRYFNGTIDDVRMYGRELSASEIKDMYLVGAGKHLGSFRTKIMTFLGF